ncbi:MULTISPECIES: hypothetical protein [Pseudomonas syringae group]|uniref:Lipoprotein n=1 Tax=Pseudomonas viridiflava TaxID=33069 RepID=A0ABU7N5Q6_PSEVI|nr:hypothetical protein [Pseudomonas viridiflava]MCF8981677.1 hypothetical protein [Pseudomonas syringae]MEE3935239.1 hypothetical protein [Pseudomonas viridiflava]MEE4040262.1 hypothetical protein [Pseudomonas viridiflava]MEE4060747.1 hypothetical protein [Pseudomonas viridiflava]MEE4082187.1 hypothetical protein [Pseudomonas viridiflava]
MKKLSGLIFLSVSALLSGCGKPNRFANGWDSGGNLHEATLREWAFSTDANRLASTADFVREFLPEMPAEALPLSSALIEKCLTEDAYSNSVENIKVRSKIEPCISYAHSMAEWLSREYEKDKSASSQ